MRKDRIRRRGGASLRDTCSPYIHEDALPFAEDMMNVGHHASGVPECQSSIEPFVEEGAVRRRIDHRAEIAGAVGFGRISDAEKFRTRTNSPISFSMNSCTPLPVEYTSTVLGARRGNRALRPDPVASGQQWNSLVQAKNRPYGEVRFDERRSVERIEGDRIRRSGVTRRYRSVLRKCTLRRYRLLQMASNNFIAQNIKLHLLLTELVGVAGKVRPHSSGLRGECLLQFSRCP